MANKDKAKYKEYMRGYMLRRHNHRKQLLIKQLGGKCVKCGSRDDLQFDHIDPKTKEFSICSTLSGVSLKRLEEEIKKCQLLCAKCHQAKTLVDLGQLDARLNHGTLSSYRYCKCFLCKKAKRDYVSEYRKTHKRKS